MPKYSLPDDAPNDLHRLLLKCVPPNEHGNKTIAHLAEIFPLRRWSVNKWLRDGKIPSNRVKRLIEISHLDETPGAFRASLDDFHRFVYND
ncbi:MAG: hypothetical protein K2X45_02490 [Phreatobacter sp.]|nr:hypothetical protein [Phreatobacter sp.]